MTEAPISGINGAGVGELRTSRAPRVDIIGYREAVRAGRRFLQDGGLVGGATIQSADLPPAARGEYSLQVLKPETDLKRIAKAKVLVVGCMDKRQAQSLYESVLNGSIDGGKRTEGGKRRDRKRYEPQDVIMLTVGGGIIQTGDRETSLQTMIDFVINQAPGLEHVVVSAHTSDPKSKDSSPCGGVKFLNGGRPLADTLSEAKIRELTDRHVDLAAIDLVELTPELLATGEIAQRHAADTLNAHKDHPTLRASVWIIVPNDETHGIRHILKVSPNPAGARLEDITIS